MKRRKCYVVATAWKKNNQRISKGLTKKQALKYAKNLRKDMKESIPKWKWAKKIRVECE